MIDFFFFIMLEGVLPSLFDHGYEKVQNSLNW